MECYFNFKFVLELEYLNKKSNKGSEFCPVT